MKSKNSMSRRVLIAGDTCPIGRNESLFQQGDATSLLNDLLPEFESADLSIVNLECPLIRSEAIADKSYVEAQWKAFSQDRKCYYLNTLHGKPEFIRRLAGKFGLLHYLDSREVQRVRLHLIRCESHREALITVLSMETNRRDANASATSKPPSSTHEEGTNN